LNKLKQVILIKQITYIVFQRENNDLLKKTIFRYQDIRT